ncbi:hypothetical protein B0J11DRAFT_505696 [Dendryphion nanum]|uniref:Uncharacterized protein n=1 Tax=Dendryphion nanum TaxID=256645 RepID=A0A9P9DXU9_9PLEO|nr:hypothetical protein B0J11DRAFT_505696 [Dendryphion nanum]
MVDAAVPVPPPLRSEGPWGVRRKSAVRCGAARNLHMGRRLGERVKRTTRQQQCTQDARQWSMIYSNAGSVGVGAVFVVDGLSMRRRGEGTTPGRRRRDYVVRYDQGNPGSGMDGTRLEILGLLDEGNPDVLTPGTTKTARTAKTASEAHTHARGTCFALFLLHPIPTHVRAVSHGTSWAGGPAEAFRHPAALARVGGSSMRADCPSDGRGKVVQSSGWQ